MLYFDHAASTKTFSEIIDKISEKSQLFANPSSVHQSGQLARQVIDEARYKSAKFFGTGLGNIIFTSGATEALNLAIVGSFLFQKENLPRKKFIIQISPLMHLAAQESVDFLVKNWGVTVEMLPIDKQGFIDLKKLKVGLLEESLMVICEHGNSEIGMMQPVAKLGKMIKQILGKKRPVFIVDVAASIVDTHVSLDHQVCDALVISGEKFGALKGIGILLRRDEFGMMPLIGGNQEFGYRGGTENLLGIWSMGEALTLHNKKRDILREKFETYNSLLRNFFVQKFEKIIITTPTKKYIPHIFHFILPAGDAHTFVQQCDLLGLCVSAGSACSSGNVSGSRVLSSLGYSEKESQRGIRISFGRNTLISDLEALMDILQKILKQRDL